MTGSAKRLVVACVAHGLREAIAAAPSPPVVEVTDEVIPEDVCRCGGLVGLSICKDRDDCQRYIHRSSGRVFAASMREGGKPCEFLIPRDDQRRGAPG